MTVFDIDIFLQEERVGGKDDQGQRQSVGADIEFAQVFLQDIHSRCFVSLLPFFCYA